MSRVTAFRHFLTITASVALLSLAGCGSSVPHANNAAPAVEQNVAVYKPSVPAPDTETGHVVTGKDEKTEDSFEMASLATDDRLSEMRGGFVSAGGLLINFGLVSSTSINNTLVSSLSLSTKDLSGLVPGSLQQLMQTGSGNKANVASTTIPTSVLTVVQNTANNQVIQNQNILDITVSNLSAYRAQQMAFGQRFMIGLSR